MNRRWHILPEYRLGHWQGTYVYTHIYIHTPYTLYPSSHRYLQDSHVWLPKSKGMISSGSADASRLTCGCGRCRKSEHGSIGDMWESNALTTPRHCAFRILHSIFRDGQTDLKSWPSWIAINIKHHMVEPWTPLWILTSVVLLFVMWTTPAVL